jgi:peptidoglycan L-alanyl-D-glutamate endopeptidase CwlK
MPPNFDYKSVIIAYRQAREKYFQRRYYVIAAAALLIFIVGGFILIRHWNLQPKNMVKAVAPQPTPMPTAIDPNFITQVNECFIPTATVYGYTLRISSGFRSLAEQEQLYAQGRTINGHIVTEAMASKSIHNYGFAIDVVDRWREYNIDWAKLGKIGSYCGLEQGPDGDYPHFEHRAGLTTADFASGLRPPPLMLPCPTMDERAKANQPLTLKDLQSCGAPKF